MEGGTSVSTALTSGLVAALLSIDSTPTPAQMKKEVQSLSVQIPALAKGDATIEDYLNQVPPATALVGNLGARVERAIVTVSQIFY